MRGEPGELRSILALGASVETFERLCELYPEGDLSQEVVEYLLEHLKRWPEGVCRKVPFTWRRQVERGRPCGALSLCNALWIEGHRALMQRLNRIFWCVARGGRGTMQWVGRMVR